MFGLDDTDESKAIRFTNQEGIRKRIEDIDVELAGEWDDKKIAVLENEQRELKAALDNFDQKLTA